MLLSEVLNRLVGLSSIPLEPLVEAADRPEELGQMPSIRDILRLTLEFNQ